MKNTPEMIFDAVSQVIKGQDEYIKTLATLAWLQNVRWNNKNAIGTNKPDGKVNALVIGGSGTGKTATVAEIAEVVKLPMLITDVTQFTGSGWKGRDLSEIIMELLTITDFNTDKVQYSIIVLDEFDKLFNNIVTSDTSFSITTNLLKFIEGTTMTVTSAGKDYTINTQNMLFICTGAFDGLEDIIKKRLNINNMIGFNTQQEQGKEGILKEVIEDDLIEYGMSAQLVGRMGTICVLNPLTEDILKEIVLNSDNSPIKAMNRIINTTQNVKISISDTAAATLAQQCIDKGTGARGLAQVINRLLIPYLYGLCSDSSNELKIESKDDKLYVERAKEKEGRLLICGVDMQYLITTEDYADYR